MINFSKYIGIPYDELNCFELFQHIQQMEFDIHVMDHIVPDKLPAIQDALEGTPERNKWIEVDDPILGDAVLMKRLRASRPSHIGIWTYNAKIIHTTDMLGCCMTDINNLDILELNATGFYRHESKINT